MRFNLVLLRLLLSLAVIPCIGSHARAADDAAALPIWKAFSPNFDDRPAGTVIDTVVLHATTTQTWQEVLRIFGRDGRQVSSHYTITRDGRIIMHVAEDKRAWHAGVSRMPDGRENVNDFSIGIELVNLNDGKDPYSREQIEALEALLLRIYRKYPIAHLTTHAEVARPPGRSSDPEGLKLALLPQPLQRIPRTIGPERARYLLPVALLVGAGILLLVAIEGYRRLAVTQTALAP